MTQPEIRLFEMNDRPLVEKFFDQMAPDSRAFFNRGDCNRKSAMKFFDGADDSSVLRWLAVLDGEMVGYVFLWDTDTCIPWLGIAVAESMRGKRFGQTLIETAASWCRAHSKGGILLTTHMANVRAQALYVRCGFSLLGVSNTDNELLYLLRFKAEP